MIEEHESAPTGRDLLPDLSGSPYTDALGKHPVAFEHGLGDDPRFGVEPVADLVPRLPRAWVRADEAQYSPHEARGRCPLPADADLGSLLRDLPDAKLSLRAYNLEHTTEFRTLVAELEQAVRAFVGDAEGGFVELNLAMFSASAGAITPAHPDRHHNLLLNVVGRKEVWVEDDPDARRHHVRTLDYFRAPHLGAPELPPATRFVLEPGQGVYIPPYAFHWATVLGDHTTGFSVGFSTRATVRNEQVMQFDQRLRRFNLEPRPLDTRGDAGLTTRLKERLAPWVVRLGRSRAGA